MASAKEMLNKTFSGVKDGIHTLMEKIPNNPLLAKENAVEITLIFIIVIVAILIFFWLYNTFTLSNTNCVNLEKIYGSDKINNSLTSITPHNATKFGGNLVDYYISTAYNCCCAGNFKNDFVDSAYTTPKLCALSNCIKQGARCLDFEIYSYKDQPVIAASSVDSFDIKETFNYLDFDTAMNWLGTIAFNNTFCGNNEDPLIINLRIMSDNIKIYPIMAQSILKQIPSQHQLDPKYNIINYCNNLGNLPLLTFRSKMIVVIDSNTYNNLNKMCPTLQNCKQTSGSTTTSDTITSSVSPVEYTDTRPECKSHGGSVYAMCGETPYKRWGIGPEGETNALGNCNYSYSNAKGEHRDNKCPKASSIIHPKCEKYDNSVYAMCGTKPFKKWGIGPEGESTALGNCNYSYTNPKGEDYFTTCLETKTHTTSTSTPVTPIQITSSTQSQPIPSSGVPCLEPNLLEVVNMHSGSPYFNTMRYGDLQLNGDLASIQNVNESLLSLLLPDYNANSKNVNPAFGMGYGCQMVAMSFQTFDANMEYYLTYFNNAGSAFIYKPNYLRYIPQFITLPPALPSSLDLSPKTATIETTLGSIDIATFPNLPQTSGTSGSAIKAYSA